MAQKERKGNACICRAEHRSARWLLCQTSSAIRPASFGPNRSTISCRPAPRTARKLSPSELPHLEVARPLDGVEARAEDGEWTAAFNAHVLQTALARCRPHFEGETWRAFELVWLEDRPQGDVARELGRRVGWVYVVRSRVLKRLWHEVKELADNTCLE